MSPPLADASLSRVGHAACDGIAAACDAAAAAAAAAQLQQQQINQLERQLERLWDKCWEADSRTAKAFRAAQNHHEKEQFRQLQLIKALQYKQKVF